MFHTSAALFGVRIIYGQADGHVVGLQTDGWMHNDAGAAGAGGWTCGRVDVPPGGHVHGMLVFARIWHLQWMPCDFHVRKTILFACSCGGRRTPGAAGAGGWTGRQADRQPDSQVDVRPGGHVHAMLLFARIWHLQWMPCDMHVYKTKLFACNLQP